MHSQTHAYGFHNGILLCGNLLKTIVSSSLLPNNELLTMFKEASSRLIRNPAPDPEKRTSQYLSLRRNGLDPTCQPDKKQLTGQYRIRKDNEIIYWKCPPAERILSLIPEKPFTPNKNHQVVLLSELTS